MLLKVLVERKNVSYRLLSQRTQLLFCGARIIRREDHSRKDAKRYRVSKAVLCAFASLRESVFTVSANNSSAVRHLRREALELRRPTLR